jgi:hypothetical protein
MSLAVIRRAALLAALVAPPGFLIGPATALAQAPAMEGTYKGGFVTDGPSGSMTLTFTQETAGWKAISLLEGEGVPPGGDPRDIKVEANTFQYAQTYGEYDVLFKGTLEGDTIKGTLEAYQGGSMVGSGTFELKKQP